MKHSQSGFTTGEASIAITVIAMILGWIINLYTLVSSSVGEPISEITVFGIIQIIGVFAFPIGSVLGYISLFV